MASVCRRRLAALLGSSLLWTLALCAPVLAHAELLRSQPGAGAALAESPEQVRLRFNEPVDAEFSPVKVYDSGGERVDRDNARVAPDDARVVETGLEEGPEGSYEVEWRVTSLDGHVIEGAYNFTVTAGGSGSADQAGAGEQESPPADRGEEPAGQGDTGGGFGRTALYSALSLGAVGLVALTLLVVALLRGRET